MSEEKKRRRKSPDQLAIWQEAFSPHDVDEFHTKLRDLVDSSPYSLTHLAECLGMGRTTFYRMFKQGPGLCMRRAIIQGLEALQ